MRPRTPGLLLAAALALTLPAAAQPPAPQKDAPKQPNGLEIWDVKEGTGEPAAKGDTVRIHYTGWTTDGKEFDSSVTRGKLATFPLNRLIKGWQEGIPGMKPGGTRRLKIPSDLAYGDAGRPPTIPAKATLIFEIDYAGNPMSMPDLKAKAWKKLDNGVRLWDVQEGTGAEVKPGATVTIHYTGWTLDGKVFDSSVKRGEPATFPLGSLIKGWQEYVPGMKVGGIRLMELPAEFAYGAAGSPPDIPPNATLVFEIEVLGAR
jgi:peptidylprolyl isomerase